MDSTDEDLLNPSYQYKKRRVTRACDSCRQRKSNEPTLPHNKCSYCETQGLECKFTAEPKKRGRAKGYVESIEKRLHLLERLVKKLCPDSAELFRLLHPHDPEYAKALTKISTDSAVVSDSVSSSVATAATPSRIPSPKDEPASSASVFSDIIHKFASISLQSNEDPSPGDDVDHVLISEKSESSSTRPQNQRFYGKTSGAMVLQTAAILKNNFSRSPVAWKRFPWEKEPAHPVVNYAFPPPDLISKLTTAYFDHINVLFPLLHKPTFQRAVESGLHLKDDGFGGVLLLVCAVGSRYTEDMDPRTFSDESNSPLSAGWRWYSQVQVVKQHSFDPPTLYDLQMYSLAVMFISGCFSPQTVWILTGFGIRLAQDVGAHIRRASSQKLTVESELRKRAFWVLVALDRMISMGIGRPCAIFDEHFDVDMPVECDDEYWESPDPSKCFKQPEGIPSAITGFNYLLRLFKISAFAMSTIYTMKMKIWESVVQEYDQHILTELDSSMNSWINSLPEYLRWDPNRANEKFLKVSGILITLFYYVRIFIHRPHIVDKKKPTPASLLSLSMCHSAARSCSLVLEQQMKCFTVIYPHMQIGSAISGLVLLLNMWGNKQRGLTADMRHVQICLDVLRKAEHRWHSSGVMLHVLSELSAAGQFLTPEESAESTSPKTATSTSAEFFSGTASGPDSTQNSSFRPASFIQRGECFVVLNSELLSSSEASNPGEGSYSSNILPEHQTAPLFEQESTYPVNEGWDSMLGWIPPDSSHINFNMEAPLGQPDAAVENTMDIWVNAPGGLDMDEWNSFLASFSQ